MRGTLRETRPGHWELRVRTGRDPLTGSYGQLSRSFRGTRREAEAEVNRLYVEVSEGRHAGGNRTVTQLLDAWIEQLEMLGRSPKTIDGYRSLIRSRIKSGLGHLVLRKLRPTDLDAFYKALTNDGLAPMTIRHAHAALSAALHQAVKWGWIDRSPAERASPPSVPHSEVVPPTADEIAMIVEELERRDHDLASMVFVAATTGLRRGELCGLRWRDIDVGDGTLVVRRSISDTKSAGVAVKDPKTHRSRRIALDSPTVEVLREQQDRMAKRAARIGVQLRPDPYIWSQDPLCAEPYRPDRVTNAFRSVRKHLGLEHIDFHHLRHFAATTLAGAGIDVRTIAGRLGHANPAITLRTYAHFLDVTDRQAAEVMGKLQLRRRREEPS
ncbi:MAG TPA: tyrosine-type recombinase/integrase [Acidimicrobiales bacterium]|nr:tyrosine-type recombinase/integrase [Acidimicrobiales bacterium]